MSAPSATLPSPSPRLSSPAPAVDPPATATAVPVPANSSPPALRRPSVPASSLSPQRAPKHTPPHLEADITTKLARNVSPGLLARMKFLNQGAANSTKNTVDPGRLDEDEIRRLDAFHKRRSFGIERRGTAWSGIGPRPPDETPVAVAVPSHSTGESVPALAMEPDTETESDGSSVVTTSDKLLPSESDADHDDVLDMQKYRLPDLSK
ncbi:hypothetical protein BKA63DRAFT_405294, partial [Paraphoma chrysanthemicola]